MKPRRRKEMRILIFASLAAWLAALPIPGDSWWTGPLLVSGGMTAGWLIGLRRRR